MHIPNYFEHTCIVLIFTMNNCFSTCKHQVHLNPGSNASFLCSIQIGFLSMIPVILYPLAKRFTYFPQFALGLTFNVGAIMGYTAVTGDLNWGIVGPLYGSCLMWTMYYDTIYAFQVIA